MGFFARRWDFPSWKVRTIPAKSLIFDEGWKAGFFVFPIFGGYTRYRAIFSRRWRRPASRIVHGVMTY
jgi:hypothetical protein